MPLPHTYILAFLGVPFIPIYHVESLDITIDIEIGKKRVLVDTSTTGERATTIFVPALTSTSELDGTSNLPPRSIVTSLIRVSHEFL